MTAREKFSIGDRVRLSEEGKRMRVMPKNPDRHGAIVSFGHWDRHAVTVLFDGLRSASLLDIDLLEKEE